jgi:hypothetical protein
LEKMRGGRGERGGEEREVRKKREEWNVQQQTRQLLGR